MRYAAVRPTLVAFGAALLMGGGATIVAGSRQAVCACGGPDYYDIDAPLAGPERWITDLTQPSDGLESTPIDQLRFLAPFRTTDSSRIEPLWWAAYGGWMDADGVVRPPPVAVAPLDAALRAGDLPRATRQAQAIVDAVLDLPAPTADDFQNELRRAVELLELAPALGTAGAAAGGSDARLTARVLATDTSAHAVAADLPPLPAPLGAAVEVRRLPRAGAAAFAAAHPGHPRAPSLRWVALQERMRAEIPDGWASETRGAVAPAVWRSLDDAHARWLADYPAHPLADLVQLSRVRVAYHEGDSTRAWRLATEPWPRRLPRLLGELRVLAVRGMVAAPAGAAASDVRLRSAMLTLRPASRAEWDALWRVAEDSLRRPWAVNLQERLLDQAARRAADGEPLPTRFPVQAAAPASRSRLWARLRMIALYAAGDTAGAARQADALGADSAAALVRTRIALGRRRLAEAAREPLLERDARTYLARVLLPDSALSSLLDDRAAHALDDSARADAAVALGASIAAQRGWRAGVPALARGGRAVPQGLAARWQRAAVLDADTSLAGRLAYARWLAGQRGRLFFGVDNAWLRSLGWREQALTDSGAARPPSPLPAAAEADAIRAHLLRTTEPYLALRAYGEWLARAESRPALRTQRREVAREADRVYNLLVNWDAYNTKFWQRRLEQSPEARAIRRAGR